MDSRFLHSTNTLSALMSKEAEEGWNLQLAALTPPVSSNRSQHNFFFFLTPVIKDFFEMWASYPSRGKTYPDQIFNFTLGMLNSPVHGNLSGISYKAYFIVCVSPFFLRRMQIGTCLMLQF